MNLFSRLLTGVVLAGIAYAQPTIDTGGVTNAASYALRSCRTARLRAAE